MKRVKTKPPRRPKNRKRPIATYHHQRRAKTLVRKAVGNAISMMSMGIDAYHAASSAMSGSGMQSLLSLSYGSGVSQGDANLSRQAGADENPWVDSINGALGGQESTYIGWVIDAMSAALAVSLINGQISGEIDKKKAESSLLRRASAEVNVVHRHGIMDSVERWQPVLEADDLGARLLWESALLPTTRAWHASRHGKTYTEAEVEEFYQRDGNIYNCHCTVVPVITTKDGTFFFQDGMQKEMNAELSKWRKESGKK